MRSRPLSVALLAVAVVLAGCGATFGSPGAGTTSPTATPTTATPSPTATATTDGTSLPPGVTDDGVDDPRALADAHAIALANTSFAVATNTTERYGDGTLRSRERTTGTFARDESRYVADHVVAGSDSSMMGTSAGQLSVWADGEAIYQRIVVDGSTSYQRPRDADGDLREPGEHLLADQIEEDRLYVLFGAFDFSVERTSEDGTERYRLSSETLSNPDAVASSFGLDSVERANLAAVVDSRGVVHDYRVTYTGSVDGRTVRGVHEVAYDDVGSATVERPSWADEAQNATSG